MKTMMVSDIHYSSKPFYDIDQSRTFLHLYSAIEKENPDLLISAGDFGKEATREMFDPIIKSVHLLTIYGNHDDIALVQNLRNADGSSCWLRDGEVLELSGLRIAGINGNIAWKRKKSHHKTVEQVKSIIKTYAQEKIDFIVAHEAPKHPSLLKNEQELGFEIFNEVVEELRPKLYLCGHAHVPSQILKIGETLLVNLDTSAKRCEYAIVEYLDEKFGAPQIKKW